MMRPAQRGVGGWQVDAHSGLWRGVIRARLRVCLGRCRAGAPAPYSALGDALRSIVRTMEATGPAERDRWRADIVAETSSLSGILGELVPDLADVLGETSQMAVLDAADARRRLHHAVIRLLSDTASYRPVVLAIDDLQWADRDTLLLLSELLTVSLRNVLVLGAHRAGQFEPGPAGLASANLLSIELAPLAPEDVEELLATVAGRVVELGDVAAEFHRRTQGNPLQVRQLLYRAQREGALIPVGPGGGPSWICAYSRRSKSVLRRRSSSATTSTSCSQKIGRC